MKIANLGAMLGLMSLWAASATAADPITINMKPGLWENHLTVTGKSEGQAQAEQQAQMQKGIKEMKERMANMTPEQRKMMEDMMAKQGIKFTDAGVSIKNDKMQMNEKEIVVKQCITQAQIDRGFLPASEDDCHTEFTQVSKNKFTLKYICADDDKVSGDGEIEFLSPKSYVGNSRFVTHYSGKTHTAEYAQQGKWLSSDCGDIKPDDYDENDEE